VELDDVSDQWINSLRVEKSRRAVRHRRIRTFRMPAELIRPGKKDGRLFSAK
jgi:hypothetical protein